MAKLALQRFDVQVVKLGKRFLPRKVFRGEGSPALRAFYVASENAIGIQRIEGGSEGEGIARV